MESPSSQSESSSVQPSALPTRLGWLAAAAITVAAAAAVRSLGRRWWCGCGRPRPWTRDVWGPHNSQHLADPYTFTHVPHGILLYALLRPLAARLGPDGRFALAIALEAAWEVGENTETAIRHYRKTTAAQGYAGDSVANSVGDIAACALGYTLAAGLPARGSVALFLGLEAAVLALCRDNFTLNVLMGTFPIEAVKDWQRGGQRPSVVPSVEAASLAAG